MAINRVDLADETLIDISDSTVSADTLAEGITAYGADGEQIVGTATFGSPNALEQFSDLADLPDDYVDRPFQYTGETTDELTKDYIYKKSEILYYCFGESTIDSMRYVRQDVFFDNYVGATVYKYTDGELVAVDTVVSINYYNESNWAIGTLTESGTTRYTYRKSYGDKGFGEYEIVRVDVQPNSSGSSYTAGNGIDIADDVISTETRIVDVTQAEYDALTDEQINDETVFWNITDAESDIEWSYITGTPNTLNGYGINDAYTKSYIDGIISNLTKELSYKVGDEVQGEFIAQMHTNPSKKYRIFIPIDKPITSNSVNVVITQMSLMSSSGNVIGNNTELYNTNLSARIQKNGLFISSDIVSTAMNANEIAIGYITAKINFN